MSFQFIDLRRVSGLMARGSRTHCILIMFAVKICLVTSTVV